MSTPQSIVVSLESANRLCEAGWPQKNTLYFWVLSAWRTEELTPEQIESRQFPNDGFKLFLRNEMDFTKSWSYYAAPTAEEILGKLPRVIDGAEGMSFALECCKLKDQWKIAYWWDEDTRHLVKQLSICTSGDTLADAAAAMFCRLAENNLLPSQ